jgi:hypothetical protein
MDDHRMRRIGENEVLFREVNERIDALSEEFEVGDEPLGIVCECGDGGCIERISVMPSVYKQVRQSPIRFFVVPGHEIPDVEEVVDRCDDYLVVEKDEGGPAEHVAERTD